jgi:hypothetical protein
MCILSIFGLLLGCRYRLEVCGGGGSTLHFQPIKGVCPVEDLPLIGQAVFNAHQIQEVIICTTGEAMHFVPLAVIAHRWVIVRVFRVEAAKGPPGAVAVALQILREIALYYFFRLFSVHVILSNLENLGVIYPL